jgi:hypothetical protein
MVMNKGTLGRGNPIVSTKTHINSTEYPYCIRKGMMLFIMNTTFYGDAGMSSKIVQL